MEFRQCSIAGKKYTERNGMLMVELEDGFRHVEQFSVNLIRLLLLRYLSVYFYEICLVIRGAIPDHTSPVSYCYRNRSS